MLLLFTVFSTKLCPFVRLFRLYSAHQGLGLLINLVEYSSRNRHCLVDMEYSLDSTCLEDSLVQPADPAPAALASEATGSIETPGDEGDEPQSSGALAALVKVQTRGSKTLSAILKSFLVSIAAGWSEGC